MRNVPWFHMVARDVISMPDKWEYPWFAAWDLAFHCAPLSLVDVDFAKEQVELLLDDPVPAPERPDPGLRVELQRRQPARDRVGRAVRLRARGRDPRRGRPRVPGARVRAAADELHVVGQPQGSRRPQPLPGRLPRPRQHRHLRSLGAAAGRRHARAGGRHGVDGPLLPVDAADRPRAGQARSGLRRHGAEVRRPLRVDRDRARSARRRHGGLWDEEDGFYYDVMRMPDGGDDPAQGALAGRPAAAVRGHRVRRPTSSAAIRRSSSGSPRSSRDSPRRSPSFADLPGPGAGGQPPARRSSTSRVCERILATMLDEDGVPRRARDPRDLAPPPRRPVRVRLGRARQYSVRYLPGRVGQRHVRRQLQLARPGVVPDEPGHPARAAPAAPLLRRPASRSNARPARDAS